MGIKNESFAPLQNTFYGLAFEYGNTRNELWNRFLFSIEKKTRVHDLVCATNVSFPESGFDFQ